MKKSNITPMSKQPGFLALPMFLLAILLCFNTTKLQAQCNPDVTPPVLTAPVDVTISSTAFDALGIQFNDDADLEGAFGAATATDNCGIPTLQSANSTVTWPNGAPKIITRNFIAYDQALNPSNLGTQTITIEASYTIHLPGWYYPGDPTADTLTYNEESSAQLAAAWDDVVNGNLCDNSVSRRDRYWNIINWFSYDPATASTLNLPLLDVNNDGIYGDGYDIQVKGDSAFRMENGLPVQFLGTHKHAFAYHQSFRYNFLDQSRAITGIVYEDASGNCQFDVGEQPLVSWPVKAVGQVSQLEYTTISTAFGVYNFNVCALDTTVEVTIDVPFNYGQGCPMAHIVNLPADTFGFLDIPVALSDTCDLLHVDLGTFAIRPCFTNNLYTVYYANYSDVLVEDTYVDVDIDPDLDYLDSSIPGTLLSGNTYRFETGDLLPGAGGSFTIHIDLDCDAPIGLTYCSEARIYPVDECSGSGVWSGADLRATAQCDGDSVRLTVENAGLGNMADELEFVVVEDLIMYMSLPFQLDAGATETLTAPANGATWRLEGPQEPGHPFGGMVAAALEGCGGVNELGLVNAFTLYTPNPFVAVNCTESSASYDPNDKQAFPTGAGVQHFIRENTGIDYMIRFQNTGTDTAFTVVVLDTLSQHLDATSIRPGSSSHNYDFAVLDGNVLRFRFNNILLPDSNVNQEASNGFVRFSVDQKTNNPDGTVINNTAAIYFDFNDPIITNTTFHTIGEPVVTVSVDATAGAANLQVYPNPAGDVPVTFALDNHLTDARFELVNQLGQSVRSQAFTGTLYQFERGVLPPGMYHFVIREKGAMVFTGTVVLR